MEQTTNWWSIDNENHLTYEDRLNLSFTLINTWNKWASFSPHRPGQRGSVHRRSPRIPLTWQRHNDQWRRRRWPQPRPPLASSPAANQIQAFTFSSQRPTRRQRSRISQPDGGRRHRRRRHSCHSGENRGGGRLLGAERRCTAVESPRIHQAAGAGRGVGQRGGGLRAAGPVGAGAAGGGAGAGGGEGPGHRGGSGPEWPTGTFWILLQTPETPLIGDEDGLTRTCGGRCCGHAGLSEKMMFPFIF